MLTSNADSLTPFRKAFQDTLFEEGKYYTIGLTVYESIGVEDIAFLFELQKKKNILFFNIALKIEAFNLDSIKLFAERINQLDNLHSGFHINIVGNELLVREKPDIDHPVLKVFLEKIKPEVTVRLIISSFGSNLFDGSLNKRVDDLVELLRTNPRISGLDIQCLGLGFLTKEVVTNLFMRISSLANLEFLALGHNSFDRFNPEFILESIELLLKGMIGLKKLDISGDCLWKNDTVFLNKLFLLVEKYKNCQDFHFVSELELKKEKLPPGWMPASKFEFAKSLIMLQTLQVSDTLPVIPLDLSESELNNLLDLYLEKRPDLISRTRTWSECYPSIRERLRLKSILAQIALLSESLLTLTDHPVAPDSINVINAALEERHAVQLQRVYVDISGKSNEELIALAVFMNQLKLGAFTLVITASKSTPDRAANLCFFLEKLSHDSLKNLQLHGNELGKYMPNELLKIASCLLSKKSLDQLLLSDNNLSLLGEEGVLTLIQQLAEPSNISCFVMSGNQIFKMRINLIEQMYNLFEKNKAWKRFLLFSDPVTGDLLDISASCSELDMAGKKLLAKFCFKSWIHDFSFVLNARQCFLSRLRGFTLELDFWLKNEDLIQCIEQIMEEEHPFEYSMYVFPFIIAGSGLTSLEKLLLLKKMIKLEITTLYVDELQLDPIQKVELFLYACLEKPDYFKTIELLGFDKDDFIVAKMLSAWVQKRNETEQRDLTLEMDYVESVLDFQEVGLPFLLDSCKEVWKNNHFLKLIEDMFSRILKLTQANSAMQLMDETESLHVYNMASWLTWVCASIASNETLNKKFSNDDEFRKLRCLPETLVEILKLANPKMRYQFTIELFNLILRDGWQCFSELSKGVSRHTFLPTILLSLEIIKSPDLSFDKWNVTDVRMKKAREILLLISEFKLEGRFFRTLLSTLQSVCADNTIDIDVKLFVLHKVLNKCDERLFLDKALIVLAPELCKKHSFEFNNDTILEALVKLYKMDKELEKRIREALVNSNKLEKTIRVSYKEKKSEDDMAKIKEQLEAAKHISHKLKKESLNLPTARQDAIRDIMDFLTLSTSKEFSDVVKKQLPNTLMDTKECRTLTRNLVDNVVPIYFRAPALKEMVSSLFTLQGLSMLGQLKDVANERDKSFLLLTRRVLKSLFDLNDEQVKLYDIIFGKCRDDSALLTYFGKMQMLKGKDKENVVFLLKRFVQSVLSNNSEIFYKMRYEFTENPHLRTVFENDLASFLKWKQGAEEDLMTFMQINDITLKEYIPNFPEFLRKKIFKHKHIDPAQYPILDTFLNCDDVDKKHEMSKLAKEWREKSPLNYHAAVQVELLLLLNEPVDQKAPLIMRYKNHIKILQKVTKVLRGGDSSTQFCHDVLGLIKGLRTCGKKPKPQDWKGWKIVDTDHFWSLFMVGTFVEGSCQNVSGTPSLNKCLMAYVCDGKNRVLAIVNEEGIIMNRCIFRILTNKKNGDSVLYREELYPDTIRSDLAEALELFAIERAKTMQLPLLVSESKFDSYAYGDVVSSLYSPAPYEYVDANYNVEENGIFDISSSQVVYAPDIRPKHTSLPSNPKVEEQSLTRAWELWKLKSQSNQEQHAGQDHLKAPNNAGSPAIL